MSVLHNISFQRSRISLDLLFGHCMSSIHNNVYKLWFIVEINITHTNNYYNYELALAGIKIELCDQNGVSVSKNDKSCHIWSIIIKGRFSKI